jgi:DNA-binding NtrC family response regulator
MPADSLKELLDRAQTPKSTRDDLLKVVIIDDDESVLSSIKVVLSKRFSVVCCSDPETGAQLASGPDVAVVIIDIKMPVRDGFWVFKKIRETSTQVPIIFNSAYQDIKLPAEVAANYRPFAYLAKGVPLRDFLRVVEDAATEYKANVQKNKTG